MNGDPSDPKAYLLELALALAAQDPIESRLAPYQAKVQADAGLTRELARMMDVLYALSQSALSPDHTCLSDEVLAAYFEGGLDQEDRAAAETHFAECPEAVHRLCELHLAMKQVQDVDEPASLVLRLFQGGIDFVRVPAALFCELANPATALLAGSEATLPPQSRVWHQQFGDTKLLMQIVHESANSCSLAVVAVDRCAEAQQLTLCQDGAIIQSEPLTVDRPVLFLGLAPGRYGLALTSHQNEHFEIDILTEDE